MGGEEFSVGLLHGAGANEVKAAPSWSVRAAGPVTDTRADRKLERSGSAKDHTRPHWPFRREGKRPAGYPTRSREVAAPPSRARKSAKAGMRPAGYTTRSREVAAPLSRARKSAKAGKRPAGYTTRGVPAAAREAAPRVRAY
jgi:hypothetical protein